MDFAFASVSSQSRSNSRTKVYSSFHFRDSFVLSFLQREGNCRSSLPKLQTRRRGTPVWHVAFHETRVKRSGVSSAGRVNEAPAR